MFYCRVIFYNWIVVRTLLGRHFTIIFIRRHCPVGYVCLGVGPNPNHGYTNFDNFLWSMLTTFQLITLDYWENVYNIVSLVKIVHFIFTDKNFFNTKHDSEPDLGYVRNAYSIAFFKYFQLQIIRHCIWTRILSVISYPYTFFKWFYFN